MASPLTTTSYPLLLLPITQPSLPLPLPITISEPPADIPAGYATIEFFLTFTLEGYSQLLVEVNSQIIIQKERTNVARISTQYQITTL